ncbi:MAG: phosphoribosylanthranilate isomerase [Proteobacteria bacterium]|nr:phosphoribosylanthranilate isomerase [Pseudomonadota bacterium]
MTRIKVCGLTRLADARAAVDAGADAIGLNFWPGTPRRVELAAAEAIVAALPPFVSVVGLFVDPDAAAVRATMATLRLDYLQFHGAERAEFCRAFGLRYLKAIPAEEGVDLLESASAFPDAAGWIFDAHVPGDLPGGTGQRFDWARVPRDAARPVILSGGLDADNVAAAIAMAAPQAVDVSSGVEARDEAGRARRGIKDPVRIRAFIEAVRDADARRDNDVQVRPA